MNSAAAPLVPRRPWKGRRVVLGVTGGIAAYKSIQLARDLTRLGADVDVVLTQSAQRFVAPLSFEGVTGRRPLTDMFSAEGVALHLRLGGDADVVCVAPATADFLARAAQGRADDLLCTTLLATRAPVVICPAMNDRMFAHPQVQENLAHLRDRLGHTVAGPVDGPLAVGEGEGPGRMLDPRTSVRRSGGPLGGVAPSRGGGCWSPLDPRVSRSTRSATLGTDRRAAWGTRLRELPGDAALKSCSSPVRPRFLRRGAYGSWASRPQRGCTLRSRIPCPTPT